MSPEAEQIIKWGTLALSVCMTAVAIWLLGAFSLSFGKKRILKTFRDVDKMEGKAFEQWCADLLKYSGFSGIELTQDSSDQGVDILARKNGQTYAIQCKRYARNIGNKSVQEAYTGCAIYECEIPVVMTNQYFTPAAVRAAESVGVLLWDRDTITEMLGAICRTKRHTANNMAVSGIEKKSGAVVANGNTK